MDEMVIDSQRTRLEILSAEHAELMLRYYRENRRHLLPWEPARSDTFFTSDYWTRQLSQSQEQCRNGSALRLAAMNKDRSEVIAVCNFTNIVRGAFQACNLGYSVAQRYQGQGLMYEVLTAAIDYTFSELCLHRIMANYMPRNERSSRLLSRLGFEKEGLARSYLKINGKWEDHVLSARIRTESE